MIAMTSRRLVTKEADMRRANRTRDTITDTGSVSVSGSDTEARDQLETSSTEYIESVILCVGEMELISVTGIQDVSPILAIQSKSENNGTFMLDIYSFSYICYFTVQFS